MGIPTEGGSAPAATVAFPISKNEARSAKAFGGRKSFGRAQSAEKKRIVPVTERRVSEALYMLSDNEGGEGAASPLFSSVGT